MMITNMHALYVICETASVNICSQSQAPVGEPCAS